MVLLRQILNESWISALPCMLFCFGLIIALEVIVRQYTLNVLHFEKRVYFKVKAL